MNNKSFLWQDFNWNDHYSLLIKMWQAEGDKKIALATYRYSIDIWFMSSKCLFTYTILYTPQLKSRSKKIVASYFSVTYLCCSSILSLV